MQDTGWAPDLEQWESDTDSEGSSDEVDFKERAQPEPDACLGSVHVVAGWTAIGFAFSREGGAT